MGLTKWDLRNNHARSEEAQHLIANKRTKIEDTKEERGEKRERTLHAAGFLKYEPSPNNHQQTQCKAASLTLLPFHQKKKSPK